MAAGGGGGDGGPGRWVILLTDRRTTGGVIRAVADYRGGYGGSTEDAALALTFATRAEAEDWLGRNRGACRGCGYLPTVARL